MEKKKKYTVVEMRETHKLFCAKNGLSPVTKHGFFGRYNKVVRGEMKFINMMERPSAHKHPEKRTGLVSRCEYYDIPYNTIYGWMKRDGLSFEDCLYKKGITPDPKEMAKYE